ncbi:GDP-fucose protein O-fucosyltransferase 1-like [Ptychodera flava]|uniref:GDP-fucose protein O-fucosyltransferase 1-like n=1 Tax=Ptychodera flava TaxID=63121 RepID=UPI003969FFF5
MRMNYPQINMLLHIAMQILLVTLSLLKSSAAFVLVTANSTDLNVDPNGYVMYCPCMGRFGNQADHFLGAFGFAKAIDRTLILPPWIEYPPWPGRGSNQIPFDTYFKIEPLKEYHRVITMEKFMKTFSETIWPIGNRIGFCYSFSRAKEECMMKDGNPFGPFWDNFKIDFDSYEQYGPMSYDSQRAGIKESWDSKFPPSQYPVLAFSGAPGSFPVSSQNRKLHKYLKWSTSIDKQAREFIKDNLPEGPFVGIHLRHGSDWKKACDHVNEGNTGNHMFASPQCLGYKNEHGKLTYNICFPPVEDILRRTKKAVKKTKAKGVFVATDDNPLLSELSKSLKSLKVKVVQRTPKEPHVDLAILAKSDLYICNCVSSFSSFATREREVSGKPTWFWGFDEQKLKEEL